MHIYINTSYWVMSQEVFENIIRIVVFAFYKHIIDNIMRQISVNCAENRN